MAPLFPAVLIGGPPHAGKSTLTYRVSAALRRRGLAHYALRASPDGEGNWSSEASADLVAELRLRSKQDWTPAFAEQISRDIANRHLPLLVDAGGVVSPETHMIAASCTHALLVAPRAAALAPWRELAARHGLPLIAELVSQLDGPQRVDQEHPYLSGVISGLTRTASSEGRCFDALIERLAGVFAYDAHELFRAHCLLTDVELVIHVELPIHPLPAHPTANQWQPGELPVLLASLPTHQPWGIYGRGPVWLYAALAAANLPQRCVVFDVRQGWVDPPPLHPGDNDDPERLRWDAVDKHAGYTQVRFSIPNGYLDWRAAAGVPVPQVPTEKGVVLDGKLPNWLWAALARTYGCPWVGVFQPQLEAAIVVRSRSADHALGSVVPLG